MIMMTGLKVKGNMVIGDRKHSQCYIYTVSIGNDLTMTAAFISTLNQVQGPGVSSGKRSSFINPPYLYVSQRGHFVWGSW